MVKLKKNVDKINSILMTMFIVLSVLSSIMIVSADGTEIISIGSAEMDPGDIAKISITIADATLVEGVSLDLVYDPDIVSIKSIVANDSIIPSSAVTSNNDTPGMAIIVLTNSDYINASTATPLIDITFEALSSGTTELIMENVELTKNFSPYSPGTVNNGEIVVTGGLSGLSITIDPVTSPTDLSYQTVTGTMTQNATVTVTCPTATVGMVNSTTTTWSVEITDMTEGDNVITATAADQLGNTASSNATIEYQIPTTSGLSITIDPVTSPTNLDYQLVTGTMTANATVTVTCPTAIVELTNPPNLPSEENDVNNSTNSTWAYWILNMTEGDNVITATATDQLGNTASANATIKYQIPTTEGEIISIGSAVADAVGDIVKVSITIANALKVEGVSLNLVYDPDIVTIQEIVANETISNSSITLNTDTPGNVTIVLTNSDYINATTATPLIDVTFLGVSSGTSVLELKNVELSKNLTPYAPGTVNNGEIIVTGELSITIDPVTTPTNINNQIITGTMTEGASVTVTCPTATVGTVTTTTTNWSVEITDMTDGDNLITATAALNGNTASANATITVDTTEPELDLNLITQGNIRTLYINSSEELKNCTVNLMECTHPPDDMFNWSIVLTQSGIYNITATDLLDNKANRIITLEIGIIPATVDNQTNYTAEGIIRLEITTTGFVENSSITICEYDENPVDSLDTYPTVSLFGINKFIQVDVDPALNDNILIVRIYMNYDGADLTQINEDALSLHIWNETRWEEVPGGVDKPNTIVWGELDHLCLFSIFGPERPSESVSTGGSRSSKSSSSSGGGVSSGENITNILLSETDREYVTKDMDVSYSFNLEGNIIRYINFTGLTSAGRIAVKVEILKNTSSLVDSTPPDVVYKDVNVWAGNAGWANTQNIANSTVSFMVEKSWIADKNIDESTITMYRYSSGAWRPLDTSQIGSDADHLFFESKSPDGYSSFAVVGEVTTAAPGGEAVESAGEEVATEVVTEEPIEEKPTEKKTGIPGFGLLVGLLVVLITVQVLRKK
jgi:PGF-pre-PGF domain-containing protein